MLHFATRKIFKRVEKPAGRKIFWGQWATCTLKAHESRAVREHALPRKFPSNNF